MCLAGDGGGNGRLRNSRGVEETLLELMPGVVLNILENGLGL